MLEHDYVCTGTESLQELVKMADASLLKEAIMFIIKNYEISFNQYDLIRHAASQVLMPKKCDS